MKFAIVFLLGWLVSFLFLRRFFVRAMGGRVKLLVVWGFDLLISMLAAGAYYLFL